MVETPPAPTPETPTVADPAPEVVATETVTPEEVLYDLPDGRKVDAATLQKEWKENFLPEYTRKSQKVAEYERVGKDVTKPDNEPEWKNPEYQPKSWAEAIEIAKAETLRDIETRQTQEQQRIKSIQEAVTNELNELKTKDPKLDENMLFQHATKYGFQNLKAAYNNMTDMQRVKLETEQQTVKNLKTRETDPVSSGASGAVTVDDGYDPTQMSRYSSAVEYFKSFQDKK